MKSPVALLLLIPWLVQGQSSEEDSSLLIARGKEIFRACNGCHNVLTDARKSGPSLRTLFGKVRLINGKRAIEQNVYELVTEGYNGMPSYKNMLRPQDWKELMAYLKTLQARPEINSVLKPIRGSDQDILGRGQKYYDAECRRCHESKPQNPTEAVILRILRDGHAEAPGKGEALDIAEAFTLLAYLKAP